MLRHWTLAGVVVLAVAVAGAADRLDTLKAAYADAPFDAAAEAPTPRTMAEWQALEANSQAVAEATAPEALAAYLADDAAAAAFLDQVAVADWRTGLEPVVMAAISQFVTEPNSRSFFKFWGETRVDARRRWSAALAAAALRHGGAAGVRFLGELRRCGDRRSRQELLPLLRCDDAALREMAALVYRELGAFYPQALSLGAGFTDGAVLQADRPVAIWGRAATNAEVTVRFAGGKWRFTPDGEGRWAGEIGPFEPQDEPQELEVAAGDDEVTLRDVRVGEVWVVAVSAADRPLWDAARPERGLAGGAAQAMLVRSPRVKYLDALAPSRHFGGANAEEAKLPLVWEPLSPAVLKSGRPRALAVDFALELSRVSERSVGVLVTEAPGELTPFTVRGVICASGALPAGERTAAALEKFYARLAERFGEEGLRLYFAESAGAGEARLIEWQFAAANTNAAVAATGDLKAEDVAALSRRFAMLALSRDCGMDLLAEAPRALACRAAGSLLKVALTNAPAGLYLDGERSGVELKGSAGDWCPAKVVLDKSGRTPADTLVLAAEGVDAPVAVRYLPAAPGPSPLRAVDTALPLAPFVWPGL